MSAVMLACALALTHVGGHLGAPSIPEPPIAHCTQPTNAISTDAAYFRAICVARSSYDAGAWHNAAEHWRSALFINDRVAEHWVELGDALMKGARYKEAVAAYLRSVQLDAQLRHDSSQRIAHAYTLMGNERQAARWGIVTNYRRSTVVLQ